MYKALVNVWFIPLEEYLGMEQVYWIVSQC